MNKKYKEFNRTPYIFCFKFGSPLDADLIEGNYPTEKCRTVREIAYSLKTTMPN